MAQPMRDCVMQVGKVGDRNAHVIVEVYYNVAGSTCEITHFKYHVIAYAARDQYPMGALTVRYPDGSIQELRHFEWQPPRKGLFGTIRPAADKATVPLGSRITATIYYKDSLDLVYSDSDTTAELN